MSEVSTESDYEVAASIPGSGITTLMFGSLASSGALEVNAFEKRDSFTRRHCKKN